MLDTDPAGGAGATGYLAEHGLVAETCSSPDAALDRLASHPPCLVLLHRRFGAEPDLGTLRRLRGVSPVPVVLRAMDADDEVERVMALELGADDYVPSGTSPREVLARIRSVLRRAQGGAVAEAQSGWRLCVTQRELFAPGGEPRRLTGAEFHVLQILARNQGTPVRRDALSMAVLRRPYHPEDRALDNLVLRLRRKLGDDGAQARLIKSVRGIGYVFVGFGAPGTRRAGPVRAGHPAAELTC